MRDNLKGYIDLLFAGAPQTAQAAETKAEILQNTLDKYDDLIDQGETPQAAYSAALAGIGDVSELLTGTGLPQAPAVPQADVQKALGRKSALRAVGVALYILCILPPMLLSRTQYISTLAPALMFVIIAIATAMMIIAAGIRVHPTSPEQPKSKPADTPQQSLCKSVQGLVWCFGVAIYFIVSFVTMAWYVTWVIFPICAALNGLIRAVWDLVEVKKS